MMGGLVKNWLCAGSHQDILQLALLADATYESLVLVRSTDREQLDLATLHATIANFCGACGLCFQAQRVHDSGEQLRATLSGIAVNKTVPGVEARYLPGASESEQSRSAQVHL